MMAIESRTLVSICQTVGDSCPLNSILRCKVIVSGPPGSHSLSTKSAARHTLTRSRKFESISYYEVGMENTRGRLGR